MIDPIIVLQKLIQCKSVTPDEGGALDYLEELLTTGGFECHRLKFSDKDTPDVENLYARWGTGPNLCFAGHTDVVPVGDENNWTCDPFGGEIKDGCIWGRGTEDMKGAVAAFAAAALNFIEKNGKEYSGSISFLITGDEEGPAINGTKKVLEWLDKRGEKIDFCIVGEPTSDKKLGDVMKIGARGSLSGKITVKGTQGHVARSERADNPVSKLVTLLNKLNGLVLDQGTELFDPSNLEIVTFDVGNKANNVIPAEAHATFNVRFNDHYTNASLEKKLCDEMDKLEIPYEITFPDRSDSFHSLPGIDSERFQKIIKEVTGMIPKISTAGGTSDARFINKHFPVIEFGLIEKMLHKVDEHVPVKDVYMLANIYTGIIEKYPALVKSHVQKNSGYKKVPQNMIP